jgi:hypothetical protein
MEMGRLAEEHASACSVTEQANHEAEVRLKAVIEQQVTQLQVAGEQLQAVAQDHKVATGEAAALRECLAEVTAGAEALQVDMAAASVLHESELARLRQEHTAILSLAGQATQDAEAQLLAVIERQRTAVAAAQLVPEPETETEPELENQPEVETVAPEQEVAVRVEDEAAAAPPPLAFAVPTGFVDGTGAFSGWDLAEE